MNATGGTEARTLATVHELLAVAELSDVVFYRVDAQRVEDPEGVEDDAAIQVQVRRDEHRMEVRCVLEHVSDGGRYVVEAASRYEFSEPVDFDEPVQNEFVARVGVMAVYPFLREALITESARLRLPAPVLGLLKAGAVEIVAERPARNLT